MNAVEPKSVEVIRLHVPLDDATALADVLLGFMSVGVLVELIGLLDDAVADLFDSGGAA